MKKSLIAAAGATLAVAAMPMAGVFAEGELTDSFTDTVKVTVESGCIFASEITGGTTTIESVDGRTFTKSDATPGQLLEFGDESGMIGEDNGKKIKFYCTNDGTVVKNVSYTISAVGGDGTTASTNMAATNGSPAITTNLNVNGEASGWAMKITSANAAPGYAQYAVIPGSSVTVASGTTTTGANGSVAFSPAYQVYIGTGQAADTYTGKVTYTLSATLTNQ